MALIINFTLKLNIAVLHFSDITYPLMTMMAGTLMLLLTISKDKYIKCKIPFFIIYFVECILEGTYLSPD